MSILIFTSPNCMGEAKNKTSSFKIYFYFLVSHLFSNILLGSSLFLCNLCMSANLLRLIVLWGSPNSELQPPTGPATAHLGPAESDSGSRSVTGNGSETQTPSELFLFPISFSVQTLGNKHDVFQKLFSIFKSSAKIIFYISNRILRDIFLGPSRT